MLTDFPIAISVLEEVDDNTDTSYVYKYVNNCCATLFKIDANEFIDKQIGFSYTGDYNGESNFYSFVDTFFKSHKKELHSIIPIQYFAPLVDSAKLLGFNNISNNGTLQIYIIAVRTEPNRAVFFAALEPFIKNIKTPTGNTDSMLLINKLDAELERIKKTLYYGNGDPALTSRINAIESSVLNASVALKELENRLNILNDTKIEELEESTYWLTVLSKVVKGKWLLIGLFTVLSITLSFDIDKAFVSKILRPIMESIIKGDK